MVNCLHAEASSDPLIWRAFLWMLSSWLRCVAEAFIHDSEAYTDLYTVALAVVLRLLATFSISAIIHYPALLELSERCSAHNNVLSMDMPKISTWLQPF